MKKMKKLFAVLLTLAMVLGMSMTSFAAETAGTASILLNNATGATVKSQQIIEADQTNSVTGWKFSENAVATEFKNTFKAKMGTDELPAKNITDDMAIAYLIKLGALEKTPNANAAAGTINTGDTSTATITTAYSSALTAAAAKIDLTTDTKVITDKDNVVATATAGLHVVKADKTGYSYNPMMAYVAFDKNKTDGSVLDATVTAKGSENQVKKAIDVVKDSTDNVSPDQNKSVTTGDKVSYTITAQYPFYPTEAAANDKVFEITDTIENATFVENSVNIYANNNLLENGFVVNTNGKKMTITFTYDSGLAGQTIEVKYDVKVDNIFAATNNGSSKVVKNTAIANANGKYTLSETESASAKFSVKKIDKDSKAALSGAEFTLYVKDAAGKEKLTVETTTTDGKKTTKEVSGLKEVITAKSGSDGLAKFYGLDVDKEYYVVETKAPAGYSVNNIAHKLVYNTENTITNTDVVGEDTISVGDPAISVKVTTLKTTTTVGNFDNNKFEYEDTKLSSLPSTGGIGTTIFTIAGCVIMIAAAGLCFANRKKSDNK